MQHTINIDEDLNEFKSVTTLAGSTDDNKRLDLVVFIANGDTDIYYKVYSNKSCTFNHGNLAAAVRYYNNLKG